MTPEEKARHDIDRQLDQCGWVVQDRTEMNISAGPGVAVREFPDDRAARRITCFTRAARPSASSRPSRKGIPLIGVETQSVKYVGALPGGVPAHRLPLPFCYESTGAVTQFTNLLEPDARSREVFTLPSSR